MTCGSLGEKKDIPLRVITLHMWKNKFTILFPHRSTLTLYIGLGKNFSNPIYRGQSKKFGRRCGLFIAHG